MCPLRFCTVARRRYTGSNVLPIVRFLHVAHLQQLYKDEEGGSDSVLSARSYLTLILPQAMVCALEVHGPDKFAEVLHADATG